jgi:hypothetical protein
MMVFVHCVGTTLHAALCRPEVMTTMEGPSCLTQTHSLQQLFLCEEESGGMVPVAAAVTCIAGKTEWQAAVMFRGRLHPSLWEGGGLIILLSA